MPGDLKFPWVQGRVQAGRGRAGLFVEEDGDRGRPGHGVSPEGLRNWVNQDKADRGQGPSSALTSDEKEEPRRLRRENRERQQAIEVLKKSRGLLREGADEVAVRYAFLDAKMATETNPGGHGVALMCRLLGVSRSGYYAYLAAREAAEERARWEDELVAAVRNTPHANFAS
ncbi:transposase [Streptomyces sp. NPDC056352]|uniref:transposase n=1 Tax=Streptomyces sp. NPDC056352 TaxID=3345791 RepID=UPI0035DA571B